MKNILEKVSKTSPHDCFTYLKQIVKAPRGGCREIFNNYFENTTQPKLQIGCGYNLIEDWLNTDLEPISKEVAFLDASKRFPFEENTFEFIFSEHIFEHLTFEDSCNMLSESFRVLKPNGVIRIAVPHADFLFRIYQNPTLQIHKDYIKWATENHCKAIASFLCQDEESYSEIYVINNFYRDWGHQVLHNYDSLEKLLLKFDFSDIKQEEVGLSQHEEICNIERHGNIIPDQFNKLETLVVEATKAVTFVKD